MVDRSGHACSPDRGLARRLTGRYVVDEFGFDPELTERVIAPLVRPLHRRYFRVDWMGLERVPGDGPALLVGNHSGTLPMDALIMKFGLLYEIQGPADPMDEKQLYEETIEQVVLAELTTLLECVVTSVPWTKIRAVLGAHGFAGIQLPLKLID